MTAHGHLSVKNQTIAGAYHHRSAACTDRFNNSRMAAPYTNPGRVK